MIGAVAGAALGMGLALCLVGRWGRPALIDRVAPYVGDGQAFGPRRWRAGLDAVVRRSAEWLGEVVGGAASVQRRLSRLGSQATTVEAFRVRQLIWGSSGFAVAAGLALLVWSRQHSAPAALLVVCVSGFAVGVLACDQALSRAVRRREERIAAELPVAAELLALAVAAGESPARGLERVVDRMDGALADELTMVLGRVRTGTPMAGAMDDLAARTGLVALGRFAAAIAAALERGTPLAGVLHAQAADVREAARRDLMESGGRREVAMMIPVVFGILPTTVIFAFYPGLVGLRLVAP